MRGSGLKEGRALGRKARGAWPEGPGAGGGGVGKTVTGLGWLCCPGDVALFRG